MLVVFVKYIVKIKYLNYMELYEFLELYEFIWGMCSIVLICFWKRINKFFFDEYLYGCWNFLLIIMKKNYNI